MSNFHDCPDCGNYHEVGERVMNPDWKPAAPAMREALEYGLAWMLEARGATLEAEEERQKALKVLRAALSAPQEAGAERAAHLESLVQYILDGKNPTQGWKDTANAILHPKEKK